MLAENACADRSLSLRNRSRSFSNRYLRIASLLTSQAGLAVAPTAIVGVVVSYLVSVALSAYVDERVGRAPRSSEPVTGDAPPASGHAAPLP